MFLDILNELLVYGASLACGSCLASLSGRFVLARSPSTLRLW